MEFENIPEYGVRVGAIITFSTGFLTTAFIGLLALINGETPGVISRVPWYLLISATAFVVTIFLLEQQESKGTLIFVSAVVVSILCGVFSALSIEGILFTIMNPTRVLISNLVLYFVAAALIGTGLGYWGLQHWREFAGTNGTTDASE